MTEARSRPPARALVGRTMLEGLVLIVLNLALAALIEALGQRQLRASDQNVQALQALGELSPWVLVVSVVLVAPVLEELIFRGVPLLPYRALTRDRPASSSSGGRPGGLLYWGLGLAGAVAFAVAHGAGAGGFTLPLPQLLLGLWAWRVAEARGLRYSMLLHATYNLLPGLALALAPGLGLV